MVVHCQQKIPQRLPFLCFPFFVFSRACSADCMGWVGRGGSYQISFQPDLGAAPAHHTAVPRVHPLQGSDRNVQMRGSWTHPQWLLDSSVYPSRKAGVPGPCLLFPTVTVRQSSPSLDRLHPNACLYSRVALKSWGCRGFQSHCRQTTRHCHLQLGASLWGQESSQADWPRPRAHRHMLGLGLWGRMPGTGSAPAEP